MKLEGLFYSLDEYGIRNYHPGRSALLSLLGLYIVIGILAWPLLLFELDAPDGNIKNYADAFWTLQMSASTIGFGDFYPVTFEGRMLVAGIFYLGVAMLGFIGAQVVERVFGFMNTNVKNRELRQQNQAIYDHNQHLERKIDQLLAQLQQSAKDASKEP